MHCEGNGSDVPFGQDVDLIGELTKEQQGEEAGL